METELTKEVIQKCLDWMQGAEGFIIDQAPDICKEIINYGKIVHGFWFVFSITIFIVGLFLVFRSFPKVKWDEELDGNDFQFFCGSASSIVTFPIILYNFFVLAKIYAAPKLYLLEKLSVILSNIT
jgi:hypothetical protein